MPRFLVPIAILLVTLSFGLWPFNFLSRNDVAWDADLKALSFNQEHARFGSSQRGLAYVAEPDPFPVAEAFSLYLEARSLHTDQGLGYLLALEDGAGRTLLSVAQWLDLVEYKRADLSPRAKRGFRYYSVRNAFGSERFREILFSVASERVSIFLDGELWTERVGARLLEADDLRTATLVVGNSGDGWRPFVGSMRQVAVYRGALRPEELASRQPALAFDFSRPPLPGGYANEGNGNHRLEIADRFAPRQRRFMRGPWRPAEGSGWYWSDMRVNFFGFIPFGACCAWIVARNWIRGGRVAALGAALLFSAALSLAIESAQCFLPTRHSSSLDLVLNACGGLLGGALWLLWRRWRRRSRRPLTRYS